MGRGEIAQAHAGAAKQLDSVGIWDVQWIPNVGADGSGEYWALICAYPKGGGSNHTDLFFAKSADGELWTTYPNPILSPRSGQWDQNFIYRSSFTYDADGKLSVWYSGGKEQPEITGALPTRSLKIS